MAFWGIGNADNSMELNVKIKSVNNHNDHKFDCNCKLNISYTQKETIKSIINQIIKFMNDKWSPVKFNVFQICKKDSFINGDIWFDDVGYTNFINKSITKFNKNNIISKGFRVKLRVVYEYKKLLQTITCPYMTSKSTKDVSKCPIYKSMISKQQYTSDNLAHLNEYHHFQNEYESKPVCHKNQECVAFIRLENGGFETKDLCHLKLYRHPPRAELVKLQENINSFIHNQQRQQNVGVYKETEFDRIKYNFNINNGFLRALIEETINNGFKSDLCLRCGINNECKHDVYQSNKYTLLGVADDKRKHKEHILRGSPLRRAQMLALVMYTDCSCNYNLCSSQRKGNFRKWKWFDHCLYWAIFRLSSVESGSFGVYSGLNNVQLKTKSVNIGYFATYVSTSWKREVAESFMSGKGMIMYFNKSFKDSYRVKCCDVSWISKFTDECEILFARHEQGYYFNEAFKCQLMDENNGVQTVSVYK